MLVVPNTKVFDGDKNEYVVGEPLGQGGFGLVYQLKRTSDKTDWALKTITPSFGDESAMRSFLNEGQQAVKIRHPNVIAYQFFHDGSLFKDLPPYIIMEFAKNGDLAQLLARKIAEEVFFSIEELSEIFRQLILGMREINRLVVHRDIKPENILIDGPVLKISDFGLAKVAQAATRSKTFKGFGTLAYMAPEAWNFEANMIQMDVYSMGIVFYQLATLQHPYRIDANRDRIAAWADAHLFQVASPANKLNKAVPTGMSDLIAKMMEKSTTKRCKNWDEVESLLNKASVSKSSTPHVVDFVLSQLSKKVSAEQEAEAKRQEYENKKQQFFKLVASQIDREILTPLRTLIEAFNNKSLHGILQMNYANLDDVDGRFGARFSLPGRCTVSIQLDALFDFVWKREKYDDVYERKFIVRKVPEFKGKRIMAWGSMTGDSGAGFNLLLLEQEDDIYGSWIALINRNAGLSRDRRTPEPFPFMPNEYERELEFASIGAMHIYNSEMKALTEAVLGELFGALLYSALSTGE